MKRKTLIQPVKITRCLHPSFIHHWNPREGALLPRCLLSVFIVLAQCVF